MLNLLFNNPLYASKVQQSILLIIRLSLGLFFCSTGFNKLFVLENQKIMLETIISAGIPFPEFMAIFVSSIEFLAGLFLILGLLTQLSSLLLLIISTTALITVGIYSIPEHLNFITWLSWFFYTHDLLYILLLFILITQKSELLSLDQVIMQKFHHKQIS